MAGTKSVVLSTRATVAEVTMVQVVAEAKGVSVSRLLHDLIVPATRDRLAELAGHSTD